ncbi:sulfotransferase family protein [Halalkalibaculum sp. DA3122]|uniref:sulfotransferase family protein n=1 Tax=unclassified Halalkalibaculum TaxID=2964617 RepID=UPI0037541C41
MNDRPIFLLGAHKSGTTLLRSIFDGHPDLFVVPFESHFFQNCCFWVDYDYRREQPRKVSRETIINRFGDRLRHLNNTDDRLGDSPANFTIEVSRFLEVFGRFSSEMNNRERFTLLMEGYHQALYDRPLPENKRIVEKSVEHAEFALFLQQMFPQARFIHIVRNPYANIVSLRKAKVLQSGFPLVFRMLNSLYNNYYHLYRNRQLIDDYYLVRYEDLLSDPQEEINKMVEFLDLRFDKSLLEPTKFGAPWSGNSATGRDLSGFDQSRIDSWKREISAMEILLLNRLFDYPFEEFGYQKLPDPPMRRFLEKVNGEGIRRYLVNRLWLAYLSYNPGNEI